MWADGVRSNSGQNKHKLRCFQKFSNFVLVIIPDTGRLLLQSMKLINFCFPSVPGSSLDDKEYFVISNTVDSSEKPDKIQRKNSCDP